MLLPPAALTGKSVTAIVSVSHNRAGGNRTYCSIVLEVCDNMTVAVPNPRSTEKTVNADFLKDVYSVPVAVIAGRSTCKQRARLTGGADVQLVEYNDDTAGYTPRDEM